MHVSCGGRARTVEIGGSDEGDVDTEVSVMSRAVQAEIDTKGNRRPGGIFGAAVEADLMASILWHTSRLGMTGDLPCWPASASTSQRSSATESW